MSRIWTGRKGQFSYLISKHFSSLEVRFQVRTDSEIFLKGEDETIWDRVRKDREHVHILFDMVEILDIPTTIPQAYFEVFLLKGFKDGIESGLISLTNPAEFASVETVKQAKRRKVEKQKKGVEDSYRFARDNHFSVSEIEAKLPTIGKLKKLVIN